MDSLLNFLNTNFIVILYGIVFILVIYFIGKIILKVVDAFLDRYRAKTALIKAQAEQAKQVNVK